MVRPAEGQSLDVSLGCGTQGGRGHSEDAKQRRAGPGQGLVEQKRGKRGVDVWENAREMLRGDGGKLVRDVWGNCFSSASLCKVQ